MPGRREIRHWWFIGNVPQTGRSGFGGRLEQGVIIQSGNDACIALADYVAGARSHLLV